MGNSDNGVSLEIGSRRGVKIQWVIKSKFYMLGYLSFEPQVNPD